MALSRIKNWSAEVLTHTDLNAEFNNILNYLNSGTVALTTLTVSGTSTFSGATTFMGAQNWVAAGGTVDAITATYSPAITALTDGMEVSFRASGANTTTTPTFAPNGLTARTIVKAGGQALFAGDIPRANYEVTLRYMAASTRWELLNPAYGPSSDTDVPARVDGSCFQWGKTYKVTGIAQSTTTDIWRALDGGGTLVGGAFMSGFFYISVQDEGGTSNSSYVYSVCATGNGSTDTQLVAIGGVNRGTALVTSFQLAADGSSAKLTLTTAASGKTVTARTTFIGMIN